MEGGCDFMEFNALWNSSLDHNFYKVASSCVHSPRFIPFPPEPDAHLSLRLANDALRHEDV
jgi:hypothetical protein